MRYCRLMLILFKPWRTAFDLRMVAEPWAAAFNNFKKSTFCPPEFQSIMDNMKLLHKCKDCHDNHFREQRHHVALAPEIVGGEPAVIENAVEDVDNIEVLQHLQSIDDCYSQRKNNMNMNSLHCIEHAEQAGLFSVKSSDPHYTTSVPSSQSIEQVEHDHEDVKKIWKAAYSLQHERWKQKTAIYEPSHVEHTATSMAVSNGDEHQATMSLRPLESLMPSIELQSNSCSPTLTMDIEQLAQKWTLNLEQQQAFKIIAEHSSHQHNDPLKMFISGPAGTRKTTVINAVKDFFQQRGQARRFQLASYMGIAACHISGMTLHSLLCLNTKKNTHTNSKSHCDLVAMWEGVNYLFIDKVSMISCQFLC